MHYLMFVPAENIHYNKVWRNMYTKIPNVDTTNVRFITSIASKLFIIRVICIQFLIICIFQFLYNIININ